MRPCRGPKRAKAPRARIASWPTGFPLLLAGKTRRSIGSWEHDSEMFVESTSTKLLVKALPARAKRHGRRPSRSGHETLAVTLFVASLAVPDAVQADWSVDAVTGETGMHGAAAFFRAPLHGPGRPHGQSLVRPLDDTVRDERTTYPSGNLPLATLDALGGLSVADLPADSEPIKPIPPGPLADPDKVALGRALFHDPRLSKDDSVACVSCHDLESGGDDGLKVSVGVEGKPGPINAPTVFNVGLNFKQFWDGRAETLEQQIDGPVQSPVELGSLWPEVIAKLQTHESYPGRFGALYPDGITRNNVKDALAEFMRSLTTPDSRFDQWLKGDPDALDTQEKRGYALFKHYGCVSCHQGANVGGNMFQVFGVLNEYFKKRGGLTKADFGRYNVTGNPADRHAFKVPSLRLAALTAPFLHDGSASTLRDAVDAMFEYQLGRDAPEADREAIVAFIRTLAGENNELQQ